MQTLLLLTGGAIALYCLWQFRRWLGEPQEAGAPGAQRLESLVDELVATAEATSAIVQEKAEALAGLIAEADRRIDALSAGGLPAVPEAPSPIVAQQAESALQVPFAEPGNAARGPGSPGEPAHARAQTWEGLEQVLAAATGPVPSPTRVQPGADAPAAQVPDSHREVYALADSGNDLTAIARRLGLTKGEVQLILGLRK